MRFAIRQQLLHTRCNKCGGVGKVMEVKKPMKVLACGICGEMYRQNKEVMVYGSAS